jgi:hypothetical protein
MNDNTAKLLEQLAAKFGTTTEYLWGVLLRQAPINSTINLIQITLVMLFGCFLYKTHKRLMKKHGDSDYAETYYEKYEAGAVMPMVIGAIVFAIFFLASFFCISNVINGYFNPEYWALDKILSSFSDKN